MLWRISLYLIFLFYTCNGQIKYAPLNAQIADHEANIKQKLTLNKPPNGTLMALNARVPYEHIQLTSQWAQEPHEPVLWPGGKVIYYVDINSYDDGVVNLLKIAFNSIRYASDGCPEFSQLTEKQSSGNYLHFTNPDRVRQCVHEPAVNRDGEIRVILGYDCLKPREVLHTVLHGLGFRDEITHPKRDLFVRVMWENIQPAFRHMFRLQSVQAAHGLAEYDPKSIMHFHDRAYSVDGQATIMPMLPGLKIEPSDKLSHLDAMKIRRIFGHECKKLQFSKVLNKCGSALSCFDHGLNPDEKKPHCEKSYENDGKDSKEGRVIIPGNDVKPEGGNEDSSEQHVVIPGHDVRPEDGNDESNEKHVVIPGNDVEQGGSNEGSVVIPGNDVQPEGGNEGRIVIPGNDVRPAGGNKEDTLLDNEEDKEEANEGVADEENSIESRGKNLPSDEAIIVGYNAESKEKRLSKFRAMKLSQVGNSFIADNEVIAVGADEAKKLR